MCIVINNKSQGSIAKHLRDDELLYYTFITQSAGERIFKIGEQLAKLQAKWLIVSCAPFALHFCPEDALTFFSVLSPSHFVLALRQSCVLSTVVLMYTLIRNECRNIQNQVEHNM